MRGVNDMRVQRRFGQGLPVCLTGLAEINSICDLEVIVNFLLT